MHTVLHSTDFIVLCWRSVYSGSLPLVLLEVQRDAVYAMTLIRRSLVSLALEHMSQVPTTTAPSAGNGFLVDNARVLTSWHR